MSTFTPEVIKADGQARVAKTAGQTGGATAVTIVGQYIAMKAGALDEQLPTEVFGAIVTILTIAAAWFTNLGRLRGEA